jgi:hypothetical protein
MLVLTPQQCGDRYMSEVERVGRGIVLLHDPYFIDGDPAKGGTVDMIEYVVPILKAKGYAFVRADQVPDVAALLPSPAPAPEPDAGPTLPPDAGTPSAPSTAAPSGPETSRKRGLDESARAADPCAR